jgi:predicted HTH domain antitoxin
MKAYSVRDLKELPGAIIGNAEKGHLGLVTKHGNPVFVAVPMTDLVLEAGVHVALAVHLYQEHIVSIGKAAKMAKMPLEVFIAFLAKLNISVVDYSLDELRAEVDAF